MKKNIWTLGMGLAMMLSSCGQPDTETYLKKVIEKMESIQSVEFQCRHIAWYPYADDPIYDLIYVHHEYSNPADTAFGGATDKPCGVRTVVATPKQLLNDT